MLTEPNFDHGKNVNTPKISLKSAFKLSKGAPDALKITQIKAIKNQNF